MAISSQGKEGKAGAGPGRIVSCSHHQYSTTVLITNRLPIISLDLIYATHLSDRDFLFSSSSLSSGPSFFPAPRRALRDLAVAVPMVPPFFSPPLSAPATAGAPPLDPFTMAVDRKLIHTTIAAMASSATCLLYRPHRCRSRPRRISRAARVVDLTEAGTELACPKSMLRSSSLW